VQHDEIKLEATGEIHAHTARGQLNCITYSSTHLHALIFLLLPFSFLMKASCCSTAALKMRRRAVLLCVFMNIKLFCAHTRTPPTIFSALPLSLCFHCGVVMQMQNLLKW
jgi:hypothetical protein